MIHQKNITVKIKRLAHALEGALPEYATPGSAGLDLPAANQQPIPVEPGQRTRIPTGLSIALPPGYEAQVRPRSGLAFKHGLTVLNSPGTIDSDYRGEIGVVLVNLGENTFTIKRGLRIAQLVIAPITQIIWNEHEQLPDTERSSGGFGSTDPDEPPNPALTDCSDYPFPTQ
ncbi:MAG: dUTP diphosphatase [Rhodospirillaceae bacterium]|nr:dUTP diphosphatase [Rhodospirillaceae bacterium]|tara:strand:- start:907 stop:1422 length:516 start_codon:yes stop_codon:yes gene_type:complete